MESVVTVESREKDYFSPEVLKFVRSSFSYLESDIFGNKRLYFENAGGSLRLKTVVEEEAKYAAYPDCSERTHDVALHLKKTIAKGIEDIRLFFRSSRGSIIPGYTASKVMFEMVRVIVENVAGTNIVTTALEHPSSFDACQMYAAKHGKQLRVAEANPETGAVEAASIARLIDENTVLLSVMLTSNITGANFDIEQIVKTARDMKPDLYIIVDAVQYAPHDVIDVDRWKIDGLNIAPYKMFGNRGVGFAYVSDRVAALPHDRLQATEEDNWVVGSHVPAVYAGFSRIIDYICAIGAYYRTSSDRRTLITEGMTRICKHEKALLNRMIHGSASVPGMKDIEGVTLHFAEQNIDHHDFIIALTFDQLPCSEAVARYGEHHVLVYDRLNSSFYSERILNAVRLNGVVRVSPLHCHTFDEIDRFLEITAKIAKA